MSAAREAVLGSIRAHRPVEAAPLPAVAAFPGPADRVEEFLRRLQQMGGRVMRAGPEGDALRPARERLAGERGPTFSAVPELEGSVRYGADTPPASLEDVELAVVRARFGVAETGSVLFTEAELGVNAVAYLAQHLIVLLDPAAILGNLHEAYARPEFAAANYCVLHTGPSATADIEGVLIQGAQGVRSLTVLLLAAPDVDGKGFPGP
ncbi:MAG: LUD domain-containing protein [Gluconacetobacter diazotrophicus]|nr:LUD domain-containing protein [Gluconacetobacter diazotrophicus]